MADKSEQGGKVEWFRRTTWTDEDRADFFAHLARSRENNRAQYLRIQAYHLQQTGELAFVPAAIELLDLMLKEYPDRMQLSSALMQRAECLAALGRDGEALDGYHAFLEAMRAFPSVRTSVTTFARFVLSREVASEYESALAVLDEFTGSMVFPVQEYEEAAAKAFLEGRLGRSAKAREHARQALAAAARTDSGFRYHKTLGLVGDAHEDERAKLMLLAS